MISDITLKRLSLLAERSRLAGGEPQDVEAVMGGFRQ